MREEEVDAGRRINQKGQRKNSESQKDGMFFTEDFNYFQSRKGLKEAETEVQSMILMQGVIIRDLKLILVADGPRSQTRGIRK